MERKIGMRKGAWEGGRKSVSSFLLWVTKVTEKNACTAASLYSQMANKSVALFAVTK